MLHPTQRSSSTILTLYSIIVSLLPILLIFGVGARFPAGVPAYSPVFQPPGWVFGVVWTYVSLTFGIVTAMAIRHATDYGVRLGVYAFYFVILLGLVIWLPINHDKNYKTSFGVLLGTTWLTIVYLLYLSAVVRVEVWPLVALLPMPFWLVLASCLNGVIYDRLCY
jgi:tryptophan-rich sensory protein